MKKSRLMPNFLPLRTKETRDLNILFVDPHKSLFPASQLRRLLSSVDLSSDQIHLIYVQSRVPKQWQTSFLVTRPETTMGASSGPRLSGMQKQVLALYRGFLRAARSKTAEERKQIQSFVSAEFQKHSKQVDRKNFIYIEYLIRRGKKQLDQLKNPDTVALSSLSVDSSQTRNSSS